MAIKKALVFVFTAIVSCALSVPTFAQFSDVMNDAWYANSVEWAVSKGITDGTGNNKFSPNQECTKAQIITFIWRAQGSPIPSIANPFIDVTDKDYYEKAAAWAYEKGMVDSSMFSGSTPCSRSMAVLFLCKNAGGISTSKVPFSDVSADSPYANAVSWAVEQDITSGTSSTTFSPDGICTRAQIVTFLKRYDNKYPVAGSSNSTINDQSSLDSKQTEDDSVSNTSVSTTSDYTYIAGADFRRIKREYSEATPRMAYVTTYTNKQGHTIVLTDVWYQLVSSWHEQTYHDITTGDVIRDPIGQWEKRINRTYGQIKIDLMEEQIEIMEHYANEQTEGVFVGPEALGFGAY